MTCSFMISEWRENGQRSATACACLTDQLATNHVNALEGSRLVISRVTSRITMVITYIRGLITPLITTHEPPSRCAYIETRS